MQCTVTAYKRKNNKENFSKTMIFSAFTAIILIIVIIFIAVINANKKPHKIYEEQKIYFVYTSKSLKQSELKKSQDLIKKLGGCGEILFHKDYYYLISSVYASSSDAKSVLSKISDNFSGAGVLDLTIKKISKSNQNLINNHKPLFDLFNFLTSLYKDIISAQISFLSGEIITRDVINFFIEKKLKFEQIFSSIKILNTEQNNSKVILNNLQKIPDDFYKKFDIFNSEIMLYFNNFINKFFESTKKDSLICEIACNVSLSWCEFCNSL